MAPAAYLPLAGLLFKCPNSENLPSAHRPGQQYKNCWEGGSGSRETAQPPHSQQALAARHLYCPFTLLLSQGRGARQEASSKPATSQQTCHSPVPVPTFLVQRLDFLRSRDDQILGGRLLLTKFPRDQNPG